MVAVAGCGHRLAGQSEARRVGVRAVLKRAGKQISVLNTLPMYVYSLLGPQTAKQQSRMSLRVFGSGFASINVLKRWHLAYL